MTTTDTKLQLDAWARLHAAWYDDPVLRAAASQEPSCMVLWPILIGMAKADSHVDRNPDGSIVRTVADLAHVAGVDVEAIKRALDTLVEGEFLTYVPARLGALEIRLSRFAKWQTPRKAKAERDERSRSRTGGPRAGKKQASGDTTATTQRPNGDAGATPDGRRETGDVDGDVDSAPDGARAARGAGEGADERLPADPRSLAGQLRRAKGQLGDLAFHVETMIGRRERYPSDADAFKHYWLPAAQLLADHGGDRFKAALGVAASEQAVSMKFVSSVCHRMASEQQRPSLALVAGGMSAEDLAVLDQVEGGDHD